MHTTRATVAPATLFVLGLVAIAMIASSCSTSESPSTSSDTPLEAVSSPPTPTAAPTPTPTPEPSPNAEAAEAAAVAASARFLAGQSSSTASEFVEAAAQSGDERWVPWMIDLLRLQVSSNLSTRIGDVLASITGIPSDFRIPNMIAYGGWASTNRLDGGEGYRDFKIALYERIDPQFGPLLSSVEDQTELASIQWGGVPVGGIPELNDPERVVAAEADWMVDDEVVLGVTANGEAVAYPLRIVARHELANDTIGGERLSIVYCTLCKSAIVFERDVDGRTLNFLTSGLLSNSNKIMVDLETNTLWSHLRGVGIGGELAGVELARRSVNVMRWSDWLAENPDTHVLRLPAPIFFDDPERPPIAYDYTPGEAYASYYDNPDVWFPVLDSPSTFTLKTEVVGIAANGDSIALSVAEVNEKAVTIGVQVGGEMFRIEPTGVGVRVFDASDARVIAEQSFWFAWYANHPDTRTFTDW